MYEKIVDYWQIECFLKRNIIEGLRLERNVRSGDLNLAHSNVEANYIKSFEMWT